MENNQAGIKFGMLKILHLKCFELISSYTGKSDPNSKHLPKHIPNQ